MNRWTEIKYQAKSEENKNKKKTNNAEYIRTEILQ